MAMVLVLARWIEGQRGNTPPWYDARVSCILFFDGVPLWILFGDIEKLIKQIFYIGQNRNGFKGHKEPQDTCVNFSIFSKLSKIENL